MRRIHGLLYAILLSLTVACSITPIPKPIPQLPEDHVYPVFTYAPDGAAFRGTAFKTGYKGKIFLMTAAHVCEALPYKILIQMPDKTMVTTKILAMEPGIDTCILELPRKLRGNYELIEFSSNKPKPQDTLYVYGYPAGMFKLIIETTYEGIKGAKIPWVASDTEIGEMEYFAIGGQSGGPVLDKDGKLVGILIGMDRSKNSSFYVPISMITKYLNTIIK